MPTYFTHVCRRVTQHWVWSVLWHVFKTRGDVRSVHKYACICVAHVLLWFFAFTACICFVCNVNGYRFCTSRRGVGPFPPLVPPEVSIPPAFLLTYFLLSFILIWERKRQFNRTTAREWWMEILDRYGAIGKARKCGCCEIKQQEYMGEWDRPADREIDL